MQLVRVIEIGMDIDGDPLPDLNPSRIYYVGQSLAGMYGTDFLAVEPDVHVGVINVVGGSRTTRVLDNFGDRPLYGSYIADRTPSLINAPGVMRSDSAGFQIMSLHPALFRNTLCALKPLLNGSMIMLSRLRFLV